MWGRGKIAVSQKIKFALSMAFGSCRSYLKYPQKTIRGVEEALIMKSG